MRLSIIIPTFQCGSFFAETLDFLMKELPGDCELVLVDDGSSDDTPEILRQYDKRYDNIRISLCAHKGASGARNAGLTLAKGDYVAFMDCDDCLHPEFLFQALPLLCHQADLYIFGIKRILCDGESSLWTVKDRTFETVSEFADEYIRSRNLLIYSNCNKFYRNSIIREHGLRFDETLSFGEDRLFNYAYLTYCGRIITSSLLMLDYIQRTTESMSGRHIPGYFERVRKLHDAKVQCFLSLSKGTDEQERISFVAADLILEVNGTLGRFESHPEEIEENLPAINRMIFEDMPDMGASGFPCGPEQTSPETWYQNDDVKKTLLAEIEKTIILTGKEP